MILQEILQAQYIVRNIAAMILPDPSKRASHAPLSPRESTVGTNKGERRGTELSVTFI